MDLIPRTGAARAILIAGVLSLSFMPLLAGLEGCANVQSPRGGPPDSIPPILIAVQPDSHAVVPGFRDEVRFEFNEAISERDVQGSATIYPFEGRPRLKKGKRNLRVRPQAGWIEDRIYHIEIEPVIQDLFSNPIRRRIRYVFSTGAPIPDNKVAGTVYDRITGRELRSGRVDLVHLPDTLRYGIEIDSAGGFVLAALPLGDFLAIGYEDLNGNRRADAFDRADTIAVSLASADTLALEFQVFKHDTLGPRIFEVNPVDSIVFEIGFDGYLDPEAALSTRDVQVISLADSSAVALDTVLHHWAYADWNAARLEAARQAAREAAARAAADTAGAEAGDTLGLEPAGAQDTVPAPADTLEPAAAQDTTPPPADTAARAPADTTAPADQEAEAEEPRILPARRIFVVASAPIAPGSYGIRVTNILNLSGLLADSEGTLEQLEPPPEEEAEQEPGGEPPPGRREPPDSLQPPSPRRPAGAPPRLGPEDGGGGRDG